MQFPIIVVIALHVMAATFWAGSTFALARLGGAGAGPLFRPQMGAATVAIITGGLLWWFLHGGLSGAPEWVLGAGAFAALAAVAVQAAVIGPVHGRLDRGEGQGMSGASPRVAIGHRVAAGLLAVTALTMAIARFV
ncbi:hypothetical protein [Phreatobacter sp. AB_2022a]|uniref:hypothetical protein n=1 Tax=Phreatobacter sp. AB_2022a TaxID=3003134 RepID=UPI0022875741|nr:hypothetical protein [Phreatobacter sp. AB_2022a]MCZ0736966.1 hypothetical protein [Phreatobacter sp. AB_2022a]